ncbi:MATE family efflux transporter [bacterium]|nr:MATE family efflux transporter [bacterium]MDY4582428.1 MATE family efflux transporter [Candidatus Faecousia sp.]
MLSLKSLFSAKDMTEGAPWKRILEFSVPMLLGNVAQQLYNTADSVIVGLYVGDNALAAVGSASPILNLLLALFVGIATGAGIVISQSFGARDREGLSKNVGNCISLTLVATVVIMVFGPLITRPMLHLLDTPESIMEWCVEYLNIFFYGIAGFFFYNMLSGVLRGLGDSVSALGFLLLAAALNVALDLLFVAKFGMGVPGVALATVIAQGISAVFCYIKLMRMGDLFDLNRSTIRLDKKISGRIISIGVPSGVTQAIMACSMMVVQSLTNSMGEMVIAANVIIMRVDGFAMMPNFSFGQAMSVYAGQNVGACRYDRVHKGVGQGTAIALSFSTVITVVLLFLNKYLFAIFTETTALIDLAGQMMRIMAVGYLAVSISQVLGGIMRGMGDTVTPMWISIVSTVVLRVPIAYILAFFTRSAEYPHGHPFSLSISLLISWTMGMVITVIAYRFGRCRKKLQEEMKQSA